MKRIFSTFFCVALLCGITLNLHAQCPPDQSEVTINIFGPDNLGRFSGENSWELIDLSTGAVIASESCDGSFAGGGPNLPFSLSTCVPNGVNIAFRAYDTFGDGWCDASPFIDGFQSNLSVQIDFTEDGSGGSCPNMAGLLAPTLVQNADFLDTDSETPLSCTVGTNEELIFNFSASNCPVAPEEDPIPTMSEWGLMIFGLLTLNMGVFALRRKEEMFA